MSDSTLEKLVAGRRGRLIVTGVTFVIALLTVLPLVDELLAARIERTDLRDQIESANEAVRNLPDYEARVREISAELDSLRDITVDEERVGELRSALVEASREAGCQVRRINFGEPTRSTWRIGQGIEPSEEKKPNPKDEPLFDLQHVVVTLSVSGSTIEVRELIRSLDEDPRIKQTTMIDMKPVGRTGKQIQLDLTIVYYALVEHQRGRA